MRKIKYIFVNETLSPSPTSDALSSIVSDFRYSHIIDAAGLSRPELIKILELTRRHYPEAKILGLSEISGRGIRPNDSMNQLRKKLSDLMPLVHPPLLRVTPSLDREDTEHDMIATFFIDD